MSARADLALILASGQGTRVGGPKALLLVDGLPLALLHLRARTRDCARAVLVTRREIAGALGPLVAEVPGASIIVSDEPDDDGPAGSLRAAAVAGVLSGAGPVIVGPVDMRPIAEATLAALVAPLERAVEPALAARFSRGHPVAVRQEVLEKAYQRSASSPPPLRSVLQALGDRLVTLPASDDPAVTGELDEIEDVRRVTGAPPRFWSPS